MTLNYFFIILGLTIALTRLWLWFFRKHGPTILSFRPHHYTYGLVLILISFLITKPILAAIGTGWIIDEIPLFFLFKTWNWPDNHWKQYHSWKSVVSIIIMLLASYLTTLYTDIPTFLRI